MRKTIAGILIGMFVGAAVEGQVFSNYYAPSQLMEKGTRLPETYYETLRLGYATGVADSLSFVVEFGGKSTKSYEEDYEIMAKIDQCLKFRGTTRGTLMSYAADIWRDWQHDSKESAAAWLAISCLPTYERPGQR